MKIELEKLISLSVETQSGQVLGKVSSFNLETESQSVLEYIVKPNNLVKDLVTKDLIISRGQVIDITTRKIIVDNTVSGGTLTKQKSKVKQRVPEGAVMKE